MMVVDCVNIFSSSSLYAKRNIQSAMSFLHWSTIIISLNFVKVLIMSYLNIKQVGNFLYCASFMNVGILSGRLSFHYFL